MNAKNSSRGRIPAGALAVTLGFVFAASITALYSAVLTGGTGSKAVGKQTAAIDGLPAGRTEYANFVSIAAGTDLNAVEWNASPDQTAVEAQLAGNANDKAGSAAAQMDELYVAFAASGDMRTASYSYNWGASPEAIKVSCEDAGTGGCDRNVVDALESRANRDVLAGNFDVTGFDIAVAEASDTATADYYFETDAAGELVLGATGRHVVTCEGSGCDTATLYALQADANQIVIAGAAQFVGVSE